MPKQTQPRQRSYDGAAISSRIRHLVDIMKQQAEWTQTDFARKTGISVSRLSHYLIGTYHPQLEAVARIASKMGVSLEWLVFGQGPIWQEDAGPQGYGANEALLAVATMLTDISDALRESVVRKAFEPTGEAPQEDATPLDFDRLVTAGIASRLAAVRQEVATG